MARTAHSIAPPALGKLPMPHLETVARLFGALSEPARLQVLRALEAGPATVSELIDRTGLRQANLSKHLGLLYSAGVVDRTRAGTFVRYRISEPMVFELCRLVCGKLQRDASARAGAFERAGSR